jgi:hypothetical protein
MCKLIVCFYFRKFAKSSVWLDYNTWLLFLQELIDKKGSCNFNQCFEASGRNRTKSHHVSDAGAAKYINFKFCTVQTSVADPDIDPDLFGRSSGSATLVQIKV